jgi:hypothetical protein
VRCAERREMFGCSAEYPSGVPSASKTRVRRLASLGMGRSPLGAPRWRFFARGRASVTGIADPLSELFAVRS